MTDRERQLESEVAWLRYGPEQMDLALRERNAVWNEDQDKQPDSGSEDDEDGDEAHTKPTRFKHTIVCVCKQCMAAHRFGAAEPDNIFNSFEDDDERECIVKKCLQYHCEKAGLVCLVQQKQESVQDYSGCHIALVDEGDTWHVMYGGLFNFESTLLHEDPAFPGIISVFKALEAGHGGRILAISSTTDTGGFFTDASGTDYVAEARKRE
jgi:hypothetical protein